MPKVTEVLDYLLEPELVAWKLKKGSAACKKIGDEAMRVGSAVDLLIRQDIQDGGYLMPEADEPVINCMMGWEKFKKDRPEFSETVVKGLMQTEFSDGDLIGHPDFPIIRGDSVGIVDLKCASGIRPKYWTQTAKYLDMWQRIHPKRFIGILRLDKVDPGKYEYIEITDETFIRYEIGVFQAYYLAFNHAQQTREQLRKQLEDELLNVYR